MNNAKWQRLCYRCRIILTKVDPLHVIVCARCGWVWS